MKQTTFASLAWNAKGCDTARALLGGDGCGDSVGAADGAERRIPDNIKGMRVEWRQPFLRGAKLR